MTFTRASIRRTTDLDILEFLKVSRNRTDTSITFRPLCRFQGSA
jgi:hypothetical protein